MLKRSLILFTAVIAVLSAACGAKFGKKGQPAAANGQGNQPNNGGYYTLNPNSPALAPAAQNYPHGQLDPYSDPSLRDNGSWIQIQGQRFYQPNLNRIEDGANWEPYQDGRWTYDNQRGWTWVSNEPWGWMTDHYGVWRHHGRHGWVWLPFRTMEYQPHCVTWFDEDQNIGWYPYYSDYPEAYQWNDSHGFDDGYWHRDRLMVQFEATGFRFRIGITMVNRGNATQARIRAHLIPNRRVVFDHAMRAHRHGRSRVGRHPGGNHHSSHDFLQRFAPGIIAPRGEAREVRSRGGARFLQPFNGHHDRRDDNRDDRRGNRGGDDRGRPNLLPAQTPAPSSAPAVLPGQRQRDGNRDGQRRGDDRRGENRGRPAGQAPAIVPAVPAPAVVPAVPTGNRDQDRRGSRDVERRGDRDANRGDRGQERDGDRGRGRPDLTGGVPSGAQSAPVDAGRRRRN